MLVDHYKSSTMNMCPHQPLPITSGPPLKLSVKADAVPQAVYTPATIPVDWQEAVQKHLARDVEVGILERFPANCVAAPHSGSKEEERFTAANRG